MAIDRISDFRTLGTRVKKRAWWMIRPPKITFKAVFFRAVIFLSIGALVVSLLNIYVFDDAEAAFAADRGSGKALIAYSDNTTTAVTRSWSPGATSFGSEVGTGTSRTPRQTGRHRHGGNVDRTS